MPLNGQSRYSSIPSLSCLDVYMCKNTSMSRFTEPSLGVFHCGLFLTLSCTISRTFPDSTTVAVISLSAIHHTGTLHGLESSFQWSTHSVSALSRYGSSPFFPNMSSPNFVGHNTFIFSLSYLECKRPEPYRINHVLSHAEFYYRVLLTKCQRICQTRRRMPSLATDTLDETFRAAQM